VRARKHASCALEAARDLQDFMAIDWMRLRMIRIEYALAECCKKEGETQKRVTELASDLQNLIREMEKHQHDTLQYVKKKEYDDRLQLARKWHGELVTRANQNKQKNRQSIWERARRW
jgi:hypothetical protein